jgi:hypothetical protein
MNLPTILRLGPLCAVILLQACQKEAANQQQIAGSNAANHLAGVIPDDPAKLSKIPLVISQSFLSSNGKSASLTTTNAKGKPRADATAPSVSIISPGNGATVSGTITVQVSASDNVGVVSVSLSVDGAALKTLTTAPYNFTWTSDGNTHVIKATAKDAAGNSSSNSVTVGSSSGTTDNVPPTVNITSPADGASVGGTIDVTVNASDNISVASVTLAVDGNVIGSVSSAPFAFSWNTANVMEGTHTLLATAKDGAGNSASSTITVAKNTPIIVLQPVQLPAAKTLVTPVPGNQGNENCCVAYAIAYGARSVEQYYKIGATIYNFGSNVFSPEYVYNQTKLSDCGSGTSITTVLDFIQGQGVATWQSMPYSDVNGCSLLPTADQVANAANYKISSYVKMVASDQVTIKSMINSNHPVIASILADNSFVNAGPGFIWSSYSGSGSLPHALIICGFDDAKAAYKVMNSWGTTWGDSGFSWISYDFFPLKASYYAYAIQ